MKSNHLRLFLQALILLSPLPFGSMNGVWEPLCYLGFAVFALLALQAGTAPYAFLHQRPMRLLALAFFTLIALQLLPLPVFLLKWLSPGVPRVLAAVNGAVPAFHPLSLVPAETALALARFLVLAVVFIALLRLHWSKDDIVLILRTALFSASFQVLFALMKLGQGNKNFFLFFLPDDRSPQFLRGTIYNADHFAFYLELLFPVALGLLFARLNLFDPGQSLREKILHLADDRRVVVLFLVAVLLAGAIYLTGCRSGIVVLVLSLLFFAQMSVYLRAGFNLRRNLRVIFILATLLAVFIGLQSTLDKFLAGNYAEAGRWDYWSNALSMFRDFPAFGTGLGTFSFTYYLYGKESAWISHAHNDYVENLADMGLLAFVAFFVLLAIIVASLLRMWIARRHPEIKPLVLGVLTAVFAAAFHSVFDFSLRVPANAFLLVILLALGLKLAAHKRDFAHEE